MNAVYRFKLRNMGIDLPQPTQKAFDKLFEEGFLSVLINDELKEMLKADLQILIDTKSYEIIEVEE